MGFSPVARGRIRWLRPEQGGRPAPPPGPMFATTARFDNAPFKDSFSLAFRFVSPSDADLSQDVEVAILALDLVKEHLGTGVTLVVLEGFEVIGYFQVREVLDMRK